jgi:hypothetical protein
MKYIYHHLGLGDHIICNGIVRHYKELYGKVTVFCKPHNYENIRYMYQDDENITVLPIGEDWDVNVYIFENKISKDVIKIGFELLSSVNCPTFDEGFYKGNNVPFSVRFQKFHINRDFETEKEIMLELNPNNEKYIFTHNIDKSKVRSDLKIIENPVHHNIFNLISLIENAEEVHLMESSIKCLVNSYKMDKPTFFYHNYVRGYSPYYNTVGLNKFEIIN